MTQAASRKAAVFVRAPEPPENSNARRPLGLIGPEGRVGAASGSLVSLLALDIRGLHSSLIRNFEEPASPEHVETKPAQEAPDVQPAPLKAVRAGRLSRLSASRLAKVGIGIALVVFFGWNPLQTLLVAASVEAVVNTRVLTIRSPIDGVVASAPRDFEAWSAATGAPTVRIVDETANRSQLDDLRRQLGSLEDERPSMVRRLDQAKIGLDKLTKQSDQFLVGRIRQLEARIIAQNHEVAAADARSMEANDAFDRTKALLKSGAVSVAETGRLRRDKIVADESAAVARQRIEEASVELAAARQGVFVGDSYNDRPASAQRAEEMQLRLGDLNADVAALDAKIERLRAAVGQEEARFKSRSDVELALPPSGRIWELLTAPGEHISRGQELVHVIDCASAVVTANVNEAVYNRLRVGSPAKFRLSTDGEEYVGKVVSLTGVAGAPANFAILPGALVKEAYHVTIAVPKIAAGGECNVGRTGRVIFENGASTDTAAAGSQAIAARSAQ